MKREVQIDIGDCVDEWAIDEMTFEGDKTVLGLVDVGISAARIARLILAARENGAAPEDLLRSNKLLLLTGARCDVAKKVEGCKIGKVREYIAKHVGRSVGDAEDAEDEEAGYAHTISIEGLRLAKSYVLNIVPGHIYNHLRIVATNEGDVKGIAEELVDGIRKIVERIKTEREREVVAKAS